MKKLKIPVLILLTLGLLILFALLPKLISSALDIRLSQTPSFSDMFSIQLNLSQKQEMSSIDKLAFLSTAEFANASQDQMTMSENDVSDHVYAFLLQCEAAGIFQVFEPSTVSMQPKLVYDLSDPSKHILVWTVTMIYEKDPSQSLLLDVDDETGQILSVKYSIYQQYVMDGVWERNKAVIDAITDLYFSQLGLLDKATEIENSATDAGTMYEYKEVDGGVTEVIFVFASPSFGEVLVQFNVDGAGGFQTTIFK